MGAEEFRQTVSAALIEIEEALADTKYLAKYLGQREFAAPAHDSALRHLEAALEYLRQLHGLRDEGTGS